MDVYNIFLSHIIRTNEDLDIKFDSSFSNNIWLEDRIRYGLKITEEERDKVFALVKK